MGDPTGAEPFGGSRRTRALLRRLAVLQGRLRLLWDVIARDAADRFASRPGTVGAAVQSQDMRGLQELLIGCAEEAYDQAVRTAEYSRTQAALINTVAALRVQWGGHEGDGTVPRHVAPGNRRIVREEIGCSLREAVWRDDKVILYRYLPLPFVGCARSAPVLISYALVNRPYILDLQPDRSLIRSLLAAGLEVYLIDWGYPDAGDRDLEMSDYVDRYLDGAISHLLRVHRAQALTLTGICQGGTLALCYCARNPRRIENLILLGTPVDFQTPDDLLSRWARHLDAGLLARAGNLPGVSLTGLFFALSPFRLMQQKYAALTAYTPDADAMELFGRMERWILDSPDQPALAFSQFLRWLYQENRLVRGTLRVGGRPIDLKRIRQPILNVYATRDHIVPPSATTALRRYVGSADYTEYGVDTGHIGLYVSGRARQRVPARMASWLSERCNDPP